MLTKPDFPEEGELVVCTVTKVQGFGAFVELDEYPGKEGFIHIAEVATGWVKRIRNYVREKQRVVCRVMHVDQEKGHIDLSLKRVNEHQKRDKIQEWKNNQKAERLFSMMAQRLKKTPEECFKRFGNVLVEKYGSLYSAFEECAYDAELFKKDGFSGDWLDDFEAIAKNNVVVPVVNIKGYIKAETWLPDGVNHIKTALVEAEKSNFDDVTIEVKYVGAPRYSVTVTAPDYKIAESELKKAIERVNACMKDKGVVEFARSLEEK